MGNSDTSRPASANFRSQLTVLGRIDLVHPAAENGHGVAPAFEDRPVSGSVDPSRHAARDREPGGRQVLGQTPRRGTAIRRWAARPDNAQHQGGQQVHMAAYEQQGWRIEDLLELGWVTRVSQGDQSRTGFGQLLLLRYGVVKGASAGDALGHGGAQARPFEFRFRGAEDGLHASKRLHQHPCLPGAQAGNQAQRKPVQDLVWPQFMHTNLVPARTRKSQVL